MKYGLDDTGYLIDEGEATIGMIEDLDVSPVFPWHGHVLEQL